MPTGHQRPNPIRVLALSLSAAIAACSGDYSGGTAAEGGGGNGDGGARAASVEQLFTDQVQPRLDFCRTCHVPGAAGDVEDGREFQLSPNAGEDLANLEASWERLGGNNPTSRILLMASGQETPHTGGAPWPEGSSAYDAMATLLGCFGDPDGCDALLDGAPGDAPEDDLPLLGSRHGGHAWFDYCEGKDDSAALPPDPRSLVQPGISDGKAVHYNAYWVDCHAYPERIDQKPHPETCGDLRARDEAGAELMRGNGGIHAGTFFNGDADGSPLEVSADQYNRLWRAWGLNERPDNFDKLLAERYGMPLGQERNPYPLPGEDPNETEGGSGQLPMFMTQFREDDGTWTGKMGFTCHACHSGKAGDPEEGGIGPGFMYGSGNPLPDISLMSREVGVRSLNPGAIFSIFGKSRGTNNASVVNVFFLLNQQTGLRLDRYTLDVITSGSTASGDTPAWWNVGSRPVKFQDGIWSGDASRVDMIFYTPLNGVFGGIEGENWVREHAQDADTWMMGLESPEYPMDVDESLARQGAILFHSKDLWGENLDNPVPRPEGGNGSCASCHGAYSPRYVNDPAFLADPSLDGVASYIVPNEIIGTDSARVDTNNEAVNEYATTSFLAYPETVGTDQDCSAQNRPAASGDRAPGYLAPPLYGVWATAPYFHNGAVPDVWGVLDPEDRPALWRRVSEPAPDGQEGQVVMGYDTSLERAYDEQRMGWKYDELDCGDSGTTPLLTCSPGGENDPVLQEILDLLYGNVIAAWNIGNVPTLLQVGRRQIENRKVYNTHLYSQGRQGHEFTRVLTDQERRAIVEYLKTL